MLQACRAALRQYIHQAMLEINIYKVGVKGKCTVSMMAFPKSPWKGATRFGEDGTGYVFHSGVHFKLTACGT